MTNSPPVLIIEPGRAEFHYWRDLWGYRELFYVLVRRDIAVRYKQAWAVIRPFITMAVFAIVFGRIAKLPSDGATPYPLMVFAGLLPARQYPERYGHCCSGRSRPTSGAIHGVTMGISVRGIPNANRLAGCAIRGGGIGPRSK